MNRLDIIKKFCAGANYYMVRYDESRGKILEEALSENLIDNEIHRSTTNKDDSMLFVYKIDPDNNLYVKNPLQLLLYSLEEARAIEAVYPYIFNWIYDGLYLKAYAIIPSNSSKSHTTITRYGGTKNFYKILVQHLSNIGKMKKGQSPDYDFASLNIVIQETEISIGSINKKTGYSSIHINLKDGYKHILKNSLKCQINDTRLNVLDMKYWAREINPDFISEAKHMKLDNPIPYFDEIYSVYPKPIRRIMNLQHKGNYNRFLISRFLLSVHSPKDARFIYYAVLGDEEREHVKTGNCSTQWNYIRNNIDKYDCPSLEEVKRFIYTTDEPLAHLLEPVQDFIDSEKKKTKDLNS